LIAYYLNQINYEMIVSQFATYGKKGDGKLKEKEENNKVIENKDSIPEANEKERNSFKDMMCDLRMEQQETA